MNKRKEIEDFARQKKKEYTMIFVSPLLPRDGSKFCGMWFARKIGRKRTKEKMFEF